MEPGGYRYEIDAHDFTARVFFNHGDTQVMLLTDHGTHLAFTFHGQDYSYALQSPLCGAARKARFPGGHKWIENGEEKGVITLQPDHSIITPRGETNVRYRWEITRDAILLIFQMNTARFDSIEAPGIYVGANQNNQARRMEKIE